MKKVFIYGGIIIAILLLIYFGVAFCLMQLASSRLAARRAVIQSSGDAIFLTDYATDPIPDEENAYYYLMLAGGDLEAFSNDWESLNLEYNRRLRPDQVAALKAIVDKYPQMFESLEQAAACPSYRPNVDYAQGVAMMLPHVHHFRSAARAFAAKGLVQAYQGDGDAALKQSELSLRLSSNLRNEPILVSHLVNIAAQAVTVETANHTLRVAQTSPQARGQLDQVLDAIDNRQATIDAMKGERAMGMQTFEQLRNGKLDPEGVGQPSLGPLALVSSTWLGQAYLYDDEDKYVELLNLQIEALEENMDRDEREDMMQPMWEELEQGGFRHLVTRLFVPALNAAVDASDRGDAKIRCLRVLMKLDGQSGEEKIDVGQLGLPASATTDPFSGNPLLILRVDDDWLVYSIGADQRDDGGKIDDVAGGQPPDIGLGPLREPLEAAADEVESDQP